MYWLKMLLVSVLFLSVSQLAYAQEPSPQVAAPVEEKPSVFTLDGGPDLPTFVVRTFGGTVNYSLRSVVVRGKPGYQVQVESSTLGSVILAPNKVADGVISFSSNDYDIETPDLTLRKNGRLLIEASFVTQAKPQYKEDATSAVTPTPLAPASVSTTEVEPVAAGKFNDMFDVNRPK